MTSKASGPRPWGSAGLLRGNHWPLNPQPKGVSLDEAPNPHLTTAPTQPPDQINQEGHAPPPPPPPAIKVYIHAHLPLVESADRKWTTYCQTCPPILAPPYMYICACGGRGAPFRDRISWENSTLNIVEILTNH